MIILGLLVTEVNNFYQSALLWFPLTPQTESLFRLRGPLHGAAFPAGLLSPSPPVHPDRQPNGRSEQPLRPRFHAHPKAGDERDPSEELRDALARPLPAPAAARRGRGLRGVWSDADVYEARSERGAATAGGADGLFVAVFRLAPHGVHRGRADRAAGSVDAAVDSRNESAVHGADGGSEGAERAGLESD